MDDYDPFVCDECQRQAPKAEGVSWCIHCEEEYQSGKNAGTGMVPFVRWWESN